MYNIYTPYIHLLFKNEAKGNKKLTEQEIDVTV